MNGSPIVALAKSFEERAREAVARDAPKHELIALIMEAIEKMSYSPPLYTPNWMFDKVGVPQQTCYACQNGGVCGCYRNNRVGTAC